jgi:hypothetical protein
MNVVEVPADTCRWVQTANGQAAADAWGFGISPPQTVDESVKGILEVVRCMNRGEDAADFARSIMRAVTLLQGNLSLTTARFCPGKSLTRGG